MRRTLVFDTGKSFRGGGSAAEQVVIPFLRHLRISSIDWLLVSHSDDDHAGGVAALARHIEDGRIFVGEELSGTDLHQFDCRAGQFWRADGLEFRFLPVDYRLQFVNFTIIGGVAIVFTVESFP